jgi:anti-sigma-K factor RskA
VTSPDIHTLAGAYALDAVDDLERAAFERHLGECEMCAVEVAEFRETVTRLADGAWSVPPPHLRNQVLARVGATPQLSPLGHRRAVVSPVLRWRRIAAACAVVGVLGVGAAATTYVVQEQRLADQRVAAATAQQRADRIQAVLAAPDAALRAGVLAGGGRVSVVMSNSADAAVVVLADAPSPGPQRAYQLWMVQGQTPTSVGLLAPGQSQATELVEGVRGRAAFAISVEPASGSPAPTTTPLVGISLV